MKKLAPILVLPFLLLLPWQPDPGVTQAQTPAGRTLKIALVESLSRGLPPPLVRLIMQPFKSLMETQTGISGDVVPGGDTLALAKLIADDKVQVGVFHGFEYAWAKQKHPKLEPIVVCVNKTKAIRILLVAPVGTAAKSHEDLAGQRLSYARTNRDSCRLYLAHRCVTAGTTPEKYYKMVQAADVDDSMDQLITANADAAIVELESWTDYAREKPGRAKRLRVVQQSELFPPGVIACYSGRLSSTDVRNLRAGLANAKNTPRGRAMLEMLKLIAFEAPPSGFDDTLKAFATAYPPIESQ